MSGRRELADEYGAPDWDDDFDDEEPCDHDDYDVDLLAGRAMCFHCGEAWWLTSDQLRAELKFRAELDESHQQDDGQPTEAQEWHDYDPDC